MKYFHAPSIRCTDEDNVLTIGLADDEFDPIDFVILSRLGEGEHARFHLLINDNDIEFENVIESIHLSFDTLTLNIFSKDQEAVDYKRIQIELRDDDSDLKRYLKRMFKHSNVELKL